MEVIPSFAVEKRDSNLRGSWDFLAPPWSLGRGSSNGDLVALEGQAKGRCMGHRNTGCLGPSLVF